MSNTQVTDTVPHISNSSSTLLDQPPVNRAISIVGRLAIAYLFCGAAIFHLTAGYDLTIKDMINHGVPMPAVLNVVAMIVSGGCALALLFNFKSRWASLILALYVVLVSNVMYGPLTADWHTTRVLFMKDMAIFGALLAWSSTLSERQR